MNRAQSILLTTGLLTTGLLTTACDDGSDPDPGMRDCGIVEEEISCGSQEPDVCPPPQCPGGALQTAGCAEDDPDCVERDNGCGDVIFCQADALPCDMGSFLGDAAECPEGDSRCTPATRLDGSTAQCLAESCAAALDGVQSPDCPDDDNVRPCDDCADPLPWCGQLWPGCEAFE